MPSDVLCESVQLPDPCPGDLLSVHNAGAYGRTMSMLLWGGFPAPVEAFIDAESVTVEGSRRPAFNGSNDE